MMLKIWPTLSYFYVRGERWPEQQNNKKELTNLSVPIKDRYPKDSDKRLEILLLNKVKLQKVGDAEVGMEFYSLSEKLVND